MYELNLLQGNPGSLHTSYELQLLSALKGQEGTAGFFLEWPHFTLHFHYLRFSVRSHPLCLYL